MAPEHQVDEVSGSQSEFRAIGRYTFNENSSLGIDVLP
jgi:hypothetical protein